MHNRRFICRTCDFDSFTDLIDFGSQPLAGFFANSAEESINCSTYPLSLEKCDNCGLLQILDLPPIEEIFHSNYSYSSSQVKPLVEHFEQFSHWIRSRFPKNSSILEFGSNDGVFLDQLRNCGFENIIGVDASRNMCAQARAKGLDVVHGFFQKQLVEEHQMEGTLDLVTCSNVFAHIDDIRSSIKGAWLALKDDGHFCVEVHNAQKLIDEGQFDTIYHEHLTYFSIETLSLTMSLNGFEVVEAITTPMHGGSIRLLSKKVSLKMEASDVILPESFGGEQSPLISGGETLVQKLEECKKSCQDIYREHGAFDGYGAAGRAQMFVSMTECSSYLNAVFDDAPIRQGKYLVGTRLKIEAFDTQKTASCCVILAWNYAEPILAKIYDHYDNIFVLLPKKRKLK